MDETRIPKAIEKILLLEPGKPKILYKKKKKSRSNKDSKFRKSLRKAFTAVADAQRDGVAMCVDRLPGADGNPANVILKLSKGVKKLGRRGLRALRLKSL